MFYKEQNTNRYVLNVKGWALNMGRPLSTELETMVKDHNKTLISADHIHLFNPLV